MTPLTDGVHRRRSASPADDRLEFETRNRGRIAEMAGDARLRALTAEWFARSSGHEYPYHFTWLGLPVIQFPQDLVAMQEIVWRVRPDVIVETGVARGGSVVFYASLLGMIGGAGRVIGVDVDVRAHNRAAIEASPVADRITLVDGSSVNPVTVRRVHELAGGARACVVALDSNHTHDHVLAELHAYSPLVKTGGYVVVFDTSLERLPAGVIGDRAWSQRDNPATAVRAFLATTTRFVVDHEIEHKLLITECPGGYLKCIAD